MATTKLEIGELERILTYHTSNQRKEDDVDFYSTLVDHPHREELINLYEQTNTILTTLYNLRLDYWTTKSKTEKELIKTQYNEVSDEYDYIKTKYANKLLNN